jgi:hypothetical protein
VFKQGHKKTFGQPRRATAVRRPRLLGRAPRGPPKSPLPHATRPHTGRVSLLGLPVASAPPPAVRSYQGRRTLLETSPSVRWSQAGTHVAHKGVAALLHPAPSRVPAPVLRRARRQSRHGEVRRRPAT